MIIDRLIGRKFAAPGSRSGPVGGWWFGSTRSSAGEDVTPETATALSAYFAALRNISEDLAKLPCPVYRSLPKGREKVDHPISRLLNVAPNEETHAATFRSTMFFWRMGWGNAYAEIERNGIGRPVALWPIHPSRVVVLRNEAKNLYLRVSNDDGTTTPLAMRNVFHLPNVSDDGVTGLSVAQVGRDSIGRALAIQKYGGAIFANGGMDRIAIKHPNVMTEQATKNLRESWRTAYGGAGNTGVAVLEQGADVVRFGIPPQDAQMLEMSNYTVEDVARWLRCPPSKIGHFVRAQGWSTLEQFNTDYVTDTLLPHAVWFEQEAARKLFMATESTLYVRHNFAGLMRGDSAARSQFYTAMFGIGVLSINDICELEDRNPIGPDGDEHFVAGNNLVPLSKLLNPDPEPEPEPTNPEDAEQDEEPADETEGTSNDSDLSIKREIATALVLDGTMGNAITATIQANAAANVESWTENMQTAFEPLMIDAITRCLRKEVNQVKGAQTRLLSKGKTEQYSEWVVTFYDQHRASVVETVLPVYEAITRAAHGATSARGLAADYAARHCDESRRAIEDLSEGLQQRAERCGRDEVSAALQLMEAHHAN